MPTSTWFGGAVGVPRPVRMKPRTTRMRVNAGDREEQRGDERDRPDEQQQLHGVGAPAHLRTVHRRTLSMSWPIVIAPLGWRFAAGSGSGASSSPSLAGSARSGRRLAASSSV